MIEALENGLGLLGLSGSDLVYVIFLGLIAVFCLNVFVLVRLGAVLRRLPKVKIVVDQKTQNTSYNGSKTEKKLHMKKKIQQKSEHCAEGQFIGYLDAVGFNGSVLPKSCESCRSENVMTYTKCTLGTKKKKRKILPFALTCLLSVAVLGSLFAFPVLASSNVSGLIDETSYTVFGEKDWVHVSVDSQSVGSVAYQLFGAEVQIVFYAYEDSGLSFDRFVIEKGVSYSDPFEKFYVFWDGQVSGDGRIYLKFYSLIGSTSTVVEGFGGETSSYGRPGDRVKKTVYTVMGDIFDVVDEDENKLCSFMWEFIDKVEGNETISVPQLTVFQPNGDVYDVKTMVNTMTPVIEFKDDVGFMAELLGDDYVKWILYGDYPFTTKNNQGFEELNLPAFSVSPIGKRVEPGEEVTVSFYLPEGVTEYEASWTKSKIWDHIEPLSDDVYADGEHVFSFVFLDTIFGGSGNDKEVSLVVECEDHGTTYSSTGVITVRHSAWEGALIILVLVGGVLGGLFVFFKVITARKHGTPSPSKVSRRRFVR